MIRSVRGRSRAACARTVHRLSHPKGFTLQEAPSKVSAPGLFLALRVASCVALAAILIAIAWAAIQAFINWNAIQV